MGEDSSFWNINSLFWNRLQNTWIGTIMHYDPLYTPVLEQLFTVLDLEAKNRCFGGKIHCFGAKIQMFGMSYEGTSEN